MIFSTLHNHTTLCDGKSTLAQMAAAAVAAGFTDLGFSCHGKQTFDGNFGLKDEAAYVAAVRALAKEAAPRLRIACGIEQDYFAPVQNPAAFDYIIGAVHYVRGADGTKTSVDDTPEKARACVRDVFGGDGLAFARQFYELTVQNALEMRPTVLAHFDLLCKFNGDGSLFDESSAAYKDMALNALRAAAETGAVFEVNTGGMARGWRTRPYPAPFLLQELHRLGAPVMLSADCHNAAQLTFAFVETLEALRSIGFTSIVQWQNGGFVETKI